MPGTIIYRGPSRINQQPIFVAAIWGSKNTKTGDMLQTYIMRSDMSPLDASKYGEDEAICGPCTHRGAPTLDPARKVAERRSCYVNLGQGPLIVWKTFQRGGYKDTANIAEVGRGRFVRIGTYGDGAAVPNNVWSQLLHSAKGHTAYTHNGGDPNTYMVSVETLKQAQFRWRAGHRTFRTLSSADNLDVGHEILCPASAEAGYRTTCQKCMLCAGSRTKAKSIAIVVHGTGRGFVKN